MGCWVISGWSVHRRSVGAVDAVGAVGVVVRRSSAASPVQPAACAAGLNQTASIPPESPAFQSICPRHNIKKSIQIVRETKCFPSIGIHLLYYARKPFSRGEICTHAAQPPGLSRGASPFFDFAQSFTRSIPILPRRPVFSSATLHTSTSSGFASLTHQRAFRRNACVPCSGEGLLAIPCVPTAGKANASGGQ